MGARPRARVCQHCRELKEPDAYAKGGRVCLACHEARRKRTHVCFTCFERKPLQCFARGPGGGHKHHCRDCVRAAEKAKPKPRTWERDGQLVRRCTDCERIKPLTREFFRVRSQTNGVQFMGRCTVCLQRVKAEWDRRWWAELTPERRAKPRTPNPEASRAASERWRRKMMADPVKHARHLETRRIEHRLSREKRGGSIEDVRKARARTPAREPRRRQLPVAPLLPFLEPRVKAVGNAAVAELLGIEPRTLYAWRVGERQFMLFPQADQITTQLGLNLWDLWPEAMAA